jgi:WD40 repeat protein
LARPASRRGDHPLGFVTGRKFTTLQPKTDRIRAIAFNPDLKTLASGGEDGMIRLWDAATGNPLRKFRGHSKEVMSVAFRKDGKLPASASTYGYRGFSLVHHPGWSIDGTIADASSGRDGRHRDSSSARGLRTGRCFGWPCRARLWIKLLPCGRW